MWEALVTRLFRSSVRLQLHPAEEAGGVFVQIGGGDFIADDDVGDGLSLRNWSLRR